MIRLNKGLNPDDATPLVTLPRRMSMRDIGLDTLFDANDTGLTAYRDALDTTQPSGPHVNGSFDGIHLDCRDPSSVHDLFVQQYSDEEDPLDLGTTVG